MLVVLPVFPVSAPFKPVFDEQPEAEILMVDLVREIRVPVQVRLTGDRLHDPLPVHDLRVGIVQRVDVHSQPQAVLGNAGGMGNEPKIERGRIVVFHGRFVIRVVFVHQSDLFDRVIRLIQLFQDLQHVLRDVVVDDHLPFMGLAVQVHMQHMKIPQVLPGQRTVILEGFPLDPREDFVRDL